MRVGLPRLRRFRPDTVGHPQFDPGGALAAPVDQDVALRVARGDLRPLDRIVEDRDRRIVVSGATSNDSYEATVTGTTQTELVPVRQGSLILVKWVMISDTNGVDCTVTLQIGDQTWYTVALNSSVSYWWELPTPTADNSEDALGGVLISTQEPINFTSDSATAVIVAQAIAPYVQAFDLTEGG